MKKYDSLFMFAELRVAVLQQYHRNMGHIGIDKTYDLIGRKYY